MSAASAPSNSVTPNGAPVVSNTHVTLEEDSSISIQFSAQDDVGDVLTYEVVTPPASGSFDKNGLVWLYTPNANFNGTDSVTFTANDGSLSSTIGTVNITVTAVNDAPKAVNDNYSLSKTATNSYSLSVLENDSDVDEDTLTIEGAAADVGIVTIDSGVLIYKASTDYVGPVNLRYSISDGQKARSNAKVSLLITGENAGDLPTITVPDDLDVNATGLFTKVKLGVATAVDKLGNKLPVSLVNSQQLFAPGNHLAYWQATDAQGRTALKSQKIRVHPLISISREQVVAEGSEVKVSVYLNGEAPEYPISVPFTISGTADANDHSLVDDQVEIVSGLSASFIVNVYEDSEVEGNEDLIINLDSALNLSAQNETRLTISEDNIAPKASIEVRQANELRTQISKLAGKVYVLGKVSDANSQDNLSQVWSSGELVLETDADGTFFTPNTLDVGIYPISLTVSDDGSPSLSTIASMNVKVAESLAVLTGEDSDGDLIPDDQEGFTDTDGDGIPDYLDAISQCNVLQERGLEQVLFLAESPSGICLSLGNIALADTNNGIGLSNGAIPADTDTANIGGIFDFIATNLPKQGDSYSFSLPQALPVPINAVYRKYSAQTGWRDFVINDKNSIASSIGEPGLCPPPGSSLWQAGLNEGHWCVQLTIQDGGANDDDGIVNGTIVDPGGVAVVLNGNNLPIAVADTFIVPVNQSRDIDVLANDTDQDNDTLMVTQVISQFGTAVVLGNQQVSYTAAANFIGDDVLVYSISDSKGGTATSKLTVSVVANRAPVAISDMASTDDRTSILVDVLANDSDPDDQVLILSSVTAQHGSVMIEGTQIRYTPKTGFEGTDTVSYQVSDGLGGEAVANLTVNVKAYQAQTINNQSGGGSLSLYGLVLLVFGSLLRRVKWLTVSSVLLASVITQANAAEANTWYVDGFVGQAYADSKIHHWQSPNDVAVIDVDDSDTAFGVSAGYQWNTYLAVELGYSDFGNGSAQLKGSTLTPEAYHQELKSVTPILADGITLGMRITLMEREDWRIEVPVGLFRWDADIVSDMNNSRLTTGMSGTDWYAGMQFSYQMTKSWSLGIGYQYIDLDPNDIITGQFSLRYRF
ncbi:Ig-like domain-containing protein [Shewanella sp. OMA3-2]|uniref:Ig-like domain-containing protein n=1 Tax=Shewanella sp. OMA3-2 TaxID=2908650 RepID=UPI001F17F392|nr:Ig-like domain-containing protein [Shewanella sp. OMA3-2]UJF21568.1 Ig-like domain-containing protein [Shewanella sp. OMA3-2]